MRFERSFHVCIAAPFDVFLTSLTTAVCDCFWSDVEAFVAAVSRASGKDLALRAYGEVHPGLDLWPGTEANEPHLATSIALSAPADMEAWWMEHRFSDICRGLARDLEIRLVCSASRAEVFDEEHGPTGLIFLQRLLKTVCADRASWWLPKEGTRWAAIAAARARGDFTEALRHLDDARYSGLGRLIVANAMCTSSLWQDNLHVHGDSDR